MRFADHIFRAVGSPNAKKFRALLFRSDCDLMITSNDYRPIVMPAGRDGS